MPASLTTGRTRVTDSREKTRIFLATPLPPDATANITGNASREVKEVPIKWFRILRERGAGFGYDIGRRVKVTEVAIEPNAQDPDRMESKLVCELMVTQGQCPLFDSGIR